MSWCRWSTDVDCKSNSDLYIYDNVSGCITVHVAGRRRSNYADNPYVIPAWPAKVTDDWIANYVIISKQRSEWFDAHDSWEPLHEDYAGKNLDFGYDELDQLREFLVQAREADINFPDYIFDYIEEYEHE
jgi:hypothetical protein